MPSPQSSTQSRIDDPPSALRPCIGTMNPAESPSTALRAPSPPLEEKDGMRGFGSWKASFGFLYTVLNLLAVLRARSLSFDSTHRRLAVGDSGRKCIHQRLSLFSAPLNAARSSRRDEPTARIQTVPPPSFNALPI